MSEDPQVPGRLVSPPASSLAVRATMQGNRPSDTAPELALRSELHRRGLRYRVHDAPVPGIRCRADLVFTRVRVAVFVDGCFWHQCPDHGAVPRTNAPYWRAKLDRNVARDRRNDAALAEAGWTVVRVWEHDDVQYAADRIARLVDDAGEKRNLRGRRRSFSRAGWSAPNL